MKETKRFFGPSCIRICLDDYAGGQVKGRVFSKLQREPILFLDMNELFLRVDELFDKAGYPQAFQQKRSFGAVFVHEGSCTPRPPQYLTDAELAAQRGKRMTLDVTVLSRAKASWQGMIFREDGEKLCDFKDAMEIIDFLIPGGFEQRSR